MKFILSARGATLTAAIALAALPIPLAASASGAETAAAAAAVAARGQTVADFYAARGWRPLWLGQPGAQIENLLGMLATAQIDGLNPRRYKVGSLQKAVAAARGGNPQAVRRAELMLSQALVDYARDLQRGSAARTIYVDPELRPSAATPRAILQSAAAAPSLSHYVARMGWMHPLYGQIRQSLASGAYTPAERMRIVVNLERARELPATRARHVLVNAAAQRLYMYENNQVVDSMRVVAGKPGQPTPNMAAFIRYTSLNPYWNVPSDLATTIIAPNVLKNGLGYLKQKGYQVLGEGGDNARVIDPATIDWKAVAAGRINIRVRQLPGPSNSMGRLKFMFPNEQGIYLHDTPRDELFDEAARLLSAGCVRLQDADRLARWLYGKPLKPQGARAEQKVPLANPVPVYLMYMTAMPSGSKLAFYDDSYGWDAARLRNRGRAMASL